MGMNQFLITVAEAFGDAAKAELKPVLVESQEISPGLLLLTASDLESARSAIDASVFVRHVFPVQFRESRQRGWRDLKLIIDTLRGRFADIEPGSAFSVQSRVLGADVTYSAGELNRALAEAGVACGLREDRKNPHWVLSVLLRGNELFAGVSTVQENRSSWSGGECRFRAEPEQISRAEFKLLEACEVFRFVPKSGGSALDLGAAPGGWTRILRKWGYTVDAVDPGRPDKSLQDDTGIHWHLEQTGEFLSRESRKQYDCIANDMRASALVSARMMIAAAERLNRNGFAVMSLKFENEKEAPKAMQQAISILETTYQVAGVRHLFHNRLEVTVYLLPKA